MDNGAVKPALAGADSDLGWSQASETILMLYLAIAQLEMAMRDSGGSVDVLTSTFTSIYGNLMGLVDTARTLPESPIKDSIQSIGNGISGQMQQTIVAFQFYDRLSQRLSHVSHSLEDLSRIVSDPARHNNPAAWQELQQKIRSKYTMEEEKIMFDTVLATGDVRLALDQFVKRKQEEAGSSDVELF
jgi:hypothetical protein